IRRQDVKGFIQKRPLWRMHRVNLDEVRKFAENMEYEAARFYRRATDTTRDTSVRQLLVELAEAEAEHESLAHKLGQQILTPSARAKEDETARRMFLLQYVQPGLAGRSRRWRRCLPPPSPPTNPARRFWWGSPHRWGRAFPWALRKRSPTTARSPGAGRRWCAAPCAG